MIDSFALHWEYEPLPPNARDAAYDSIGDLGFSRNAILDNYRFSLSNGVAIEINALAFAHPTYRSPAEYAGFTLFNSANGYSNEQLVPFLAQSAAPFHLIHKHKDQKYSFYASSINYDSRTTIKTVQNDIEYDQLKSVLTDYKIDLNPKRIVDVKQGREQFVSEIFRDIKPLQLSLWALSVTGPRLSGHFSNAIAYLRASELLEEDITEIAVQLLGATILADTGALGEVARKDRHLSLSEVMLLANKHFENYFQLNTIEKYQQVAAPAYNTLRQISYANFTPDMLAELYLTAYADRKQRKELGRYDTPTYLTRRIWNNIPVEYLPPEQRVTVDMTCGWGSFLITGQERISSLPDMKGISLRDTLYGNDKDYFTAKLAGLGLLLSTLEDSWKIDAQDAIEWDWLKNNSPNIIVGNPPFNRNKKLSISFQQANRFLHYAIERLAPNGYLAMLMPQVFVMTEDSPNLRKELLERCDVFELWELPNQIFGPIEATQEVVVLFAKKKQLRGRSSNVPVRIRNVQNNTVVDPTDRSFRNPDGAFTTSTIAEQSGWNEESFSKANNTHIMKYNLILSESTWHDINSRCLHLADVTHIVQGTIRGNKVENKRYLNYENPKTVNWLTKARDVMPEPFLLNYDLAEKIVYPNDLEKPRLEKEKLLASEKVLLTTISNPSWGKRVKVAIERRGYYVSHSFWVFVPKKKYHNLTLEVVAAILNWDIANAWLIEHKKSTTPPKYAIDTIPFPVLSKKDCENLTQLVHVLEQSRNSDLIQHTKDQIDEILVRAYELDETTFARIRLVSNWKEQGLITLDDSGTSEYTDWIISGITDSVNVSEGTITLWLDGFSELQTVPIVPIMPGWLLREEAAFSTKIPRRCLHEGSLEHVTWATFLPQMYTYLDEDQLADEFLKLFSSDKPQ